MSQISSLSTAHNKARLQISREHVRRARARRRKVKPNPRTVNGVSLVYLTRATVLMAFLVRPKTSSRVSGRFSRVARRALVVQAPTSTFQLPPRANERCVPAVSWTSILSTDTIASDGWTDWYKRTSVPRGGRGRAGTYGIPWPRGINGTARRRIPFWNLAHVSSSGAVERFSPEDVSSGEQSSTIIKQQSVAVTRPGTPEDARTRRPHSPNDTRASLCTIET